MISIFSLIYASTAYADSVFESVMRNTPQIDAGQAEFFFLANNATEDVLLHLDIKGYPYYVREEPELGPAEDGIFDDPKFAYMRHVYRGWNEAILYAAGDVIVPVNSDHVFAPGWLSVLQEHWTPGVALSPVMVERRHPHFKQLRGTSSFVHDCGTHPSNFQLDSFMQFVEATRRGKTTTGGVYMPCMMLKQSVIDAGMFPPGNLTSDRGIWRVSGWPGDMELFARLAKLGIEHKTCWLSFVYHYQCGEMTECQKQQSE